MRDTSPVERVIHLTLSIMPLFIFLASCAIAKKETSAIEIASATPTTRDMTPSLVSPSLLGEWDMRHVYDMAWSPDGGMFVVNSQLQQNEPNSVQAFDTYSRKRIWIAENTLSLDLTFSTDGQSIVETNPLVGTLYLRSVKEGRFGTSDYI